MSLIDQFNIKFFDWSNGKILSGRCEYGQSHSNKYSRMLFCIYDVTNALTKLHAHRDTLRTRNPSLDIRAS